MKIKICFILFIFFSLCWPISYVKCANEEFYIMLGTIEEKKGNYDRAIIEYNKALTENPLFTAIYTIIGNIYLNNLNDIDNAIKTYKEGLKHFPKDKALNLGIMQAYFFLGDIDNGIKYYKKLSNIIKIQGRYSFPIKIVKKITSGFNQAEVLSFCKKYLKINPTDVILREISSDIYLKNNEFENAKAELEVLLKYSQNFGEIYFDLGVCEYNLGDYNKSFYYLNEAKKAGTYVPKEYFEMLSKKTGAQ